MNVQAAANNHAGAGSITFLSYTLMRGASLPAMRWFGVAGFLTIWLTVEFLQVVVIHYYNTRLFNGRAEVNLRPAGRLTLALAALVAVVLSCRRFLESRHYFWQGVTAVSAVTILSVISYF